MASELFGLKNAYVLHLPGRLIDKSMRLVDRLLENLPTRILALIVFLASLFCFPSQGLAQLPIVNLTPGDTDASEAGPDPGSLIISRDGGTISEALQVKVNVSGSATIELDYTTNPPLIRMYSDLYHVTIPPNQMTETVIMTPVRDGINEGDETIVVALAVDSAYTVGSDDMAQLTIADDSPIVELATVDAIATEAGPNPGSFIISRSGGIVSEALQVKVNVSGSATFDGDYTTNPHLTRMYSDLYHVTIPPDQMTETVIMTPVQDGVVEGDETMVVALAVDPIYTVGSKDMVRLTIADDPPTVELTTGDTIAAEAGPNPGSFIISRSGGLLSEALQIRVAVSGTATIEADYTTNPPLTRMYSDIYQVMIPPDQITMPVMITPVNDGVIESDEMANFTLIDYTNYTVGEAGLASVTIADYVGGIFKDGFETPR